MLSKGREEEGITINIGRIENFQKFLMYKFFFFSISILVFYFVPNRNLSTYVHVQISSTIYLQPHCSHR